MNMSLSLPPSASHSLPLPRLGIYNPSSSSPLFPQIFPSPQPVGLVLVLVLVLFWFSFDFVVFFGWGGGMKYEVRGKE